MKNLDVKKLLVLILIIALIGIIIFFVIKGLNKEKITEEEKELAETRIAEYYTSLTYGFNTQYSGIDVLYNADSIVFDDLSRASVLNIAATYASSTEYNNNISQNIVEKLKAKGTYGNIDEASLYLGSSIRKAIKDLFDVNIEDTSAADNYDYIYDYYYDKEYDIYISVRNDVTDYSTPNEYVDYSIIETVKEKDKIKSTVAIAYAYNDGTNTNYYKDRNGEKVVAENVTEFPKDKIDEFDKYVFTLKKAQDNDKNYVFESIEKVK